MNQGITSAAFGLHDYNTLVVVVGTTLLGIAAGVVGTFAYLRKRAMMGDALSHATLPGVAAVFLLTGEKSLTALLLGAAATSILGVFSVIGLRRYSRLKEDAAIGVVLSVFFGTGIVLMTIVQKMNTGNEAGVNRFIYGKSAGMLASDAWIIGATALIALFCVVMFFKEMRLICFDPQYAAAQGWPVVLIDLLMMGLVVLTTVVGLQSVGLILVIALLIVPAATARFWTDGLLSMTCIAGLLGALSGWLGSTISSMYPRMPTGPIIVVMAGVFFLVSMLLAPRRGVVAALTRARQFRLKIGYQNLLRALAEAEEQSGETRSVAFGELFSKRGWTQGLLRRLIRGAERRGAVTFDTDRRVMLTRKGRPEAARILRNHRLWEMYLIRYADIAPSHVDRDADWVEHVLEPDIVRELERAVEEVRGIPPSPHQIGVAP
ncbi:MAG: iron chelate uptake ABC transporter family permease subunit [Phycisphaerae bacterium]